MSMMCQLPSSCLKTGKKSLDWGSSQRGYQEVQNCVVSSFQCCKERQGLET